MSFVKCDVYQECQALHDAAAKGADGCCGTSQCPNVTLPHREFRIGYYGEWAPEMEFKFHALCIVVGEQREIIASLMERLDVQAEAIARLHGAVAISTQPVSTPFPTATELAKQVMADVNCYGSVTGKTLALLRLGAK